MQREVVKQTLIKFQNRLGANYLNIKQFVIKSIILIYYLMIGIYENVCLNIYKNSRILCPP